MSHANFIVFCSLLAHFICFIWLLNKGRRIALPPPRSFRNGYLFFVYFFPEMSIFLNCDKIRAQTEKEFYGMMNMLFAETLKKLRSEKGLSQRELAERMHVTRSAMVRWENGSRLPDAAMITLLSDALGADVSTLLSAAAQSDESPCVIMVDDSKAILVDGLSVLEEVLPTAEITGFIRPREAIEYTKTNRVALAFLDIELGAVSGLDLCRKLLEINSRMNIVFLTAYPDYALDAWETGAVGFLVKPLTPERVREQLKKLRYPFHVGGMDA